MQCTCICTGVGDPSVQLRNTTIPRQAIFVIYPRLMKEHLMAVGVYEELEAPARGGGTLLYEHLQYGE